MVYKLVVLITIISSVLPILYAQDELALSLPCQNCGQKVVKTFTWCTTTFNKVVKIVPIDVKVADCNSKPTCESFKCPKPLVQKCVPVNYGTFDATLLLHKPPLGVQCIIPTSCFCKCEWPKQILFPVDQMPLSTE